MLIENVEVLPRLTHRETEVLELAARGLTSKEIALRIGIAPRTVERHIENARLRMGARNRAHLISKAARAGILAAQMPTLLSTLDQQLDLQF